MRVQIKPCLHVPTFGRAYGQRGFGRVDVPDHTQVQCESEGHVVPTAGKGGLRVRVRFRMVTVRRFW